MSQFKRSLAIVIGIDHYQNGIVPLKTAISDSRELARLLKSKHDYTVELYTDEDATLGNLEQLFTVRLPDIVSPEDRLLLYFAGHGIALDGDEGPTGYLIPQDAKIGEQRSFYPMSALHDAIAELPCRHFLGIFDCCFAGAFRWASTRDIILAPQLIHKERFERFIQDSAWQVITSAAYNQKAIDVLLEDERGESNNRHSPFANALFNALHGQADIFPPARSGCSAGDGIITATELYLYLRDNLESLTENHTSRQTPGLWPLKKHDKGEYIFLTPDHVLDLPPAPKLNKKNNPYRGLESFDEEHSHLFFGREAIVKQLFDKISEGQALTIVTGPSGSGKSSLVKAGLLPRLRSSTQNFLIVPVMRPGAKPLHLLAKMCCLLLSQTDTGEENIQKIYNRLIASSDYLSKVIEKWKKASNQKILLVIDQLEELVTICSQSHDREHFQKLLRIALLGHPEIFRVVITLRVDFEAQFQIKGWTPSWISSRFLVPSMTQNELRRVIEGPAAERTLFFEPHTLVDHLINEVIQMPGALPLLSFTLSELYLQYLVRRDGSRSLTWRDYKDIGGVTGSITRRATQEYNALVDLDPSQTTTIPQVMMRMISVEGGEPVRRRVLKSDLVYPNQLKTARVVDVIRRYSDARLIVEGQDTDGEPYVEPAHDALVRGWDKLQVWKSESLETLSLQRTFSAAAKEWTLNDKNKRFLWNSNPRILILKAILESKNHWFNTQEYDFLRHSLNRRKSNRYRIIGSVASAFVVIGAVAVFASIQQRIAQRNEKIAIDQRNTAIARQLATQAERLGTQRINLKMTSALLAVESLKFFEAARSVPLEVDQALRSGLKMLPRLLHRLDHGQNTEKIIFSPDGRLLAAVGRNSVELWDAVSGQHIAKLKHDTSVHDACFSSDGKMIATASSDKTARIWQTEDGEELNRFDYRGDARAVAFGANDKTLAVGGRSVAIEIWDIELGTMKDRLYGGSVNTMVFSPDGETLAAAGSSKVTFWNANNGSKTLSPDYEGRVSQVEPLEHQDLISTIRFSSDGRLLVTASDDGTSKVWHVGDEKEILSFMHEDEINEAVFSPDGKTVATASDDATARIWNIETGKEILRLDHVYDVDGISFSPDGTMVVTAGLNSTARLWAVLDGRELSRFSHDDGVDAVAFGLDGKTIATADGSSTNLWEIEDNEKVFHVAHEDSIWDIEFSADGKTIATTSLDNTARLWDVASQEEMVRFVHDDYIRDVTFNSDNTIVATASGDSTARLWDIKTGKELARFVHNDRVYSANFNPTDEFLLTASRDNTARLWNTLDKKEVFQFPHEDWVNIAIFSPDAKTIATASRDNTAVIWNAATGQKLFQLDHDSSVDDLTFSPDSKKLLTASSDGIGYLWNLETGNKIAALLHDDDAIAVDIISVAFSPDGKTAATASADSTARLWNESGEEIARLNHEDVVLRIVFSSDGDAIATTSQDGTARIWDATTGAELARMEHEKEATALTFSPDNRYLATASEDFSVQIWHRYPAALATEICARASRNLTAFEWTSYLGIGLENYALTCKDLPVHSSVLSQAWEYAESNIPKAVPIFERILELEPDSYIGTASHKDDRDPQRTAGRIYAAEKIRQGRELAYYDDIGGAIQNYEEAQSYVEITASEWNTLCYLASLHWKAQDVMFACDNAIELDPDNSDIRFSRVMARAMTGDIEGALKDARSFTVEVGDIESEMQQVLIEALLRGKNPFDKTTVEQLGIIEGFENK